MISAFYPGETLEMIMPRINMQKINHIIERTPFITDLQKQFYRTMLAKRKEKILDYAYKK